MTRREEQVIEAALLRMNARAWAVALGLLAGGSLFLATIVLVLRGGSTVGPHLGLLRVYFPGYNVTVAGSLVGFLYGFCLGCGVGWVIGRLYNRLIDRPR